MHKLGNFLKQIKLPQLVADSQLTSVSFDEKRNVLTLYINAEKQIEFSEFSNSEKAIEAELELNNVRIVPKVLEQLPPSEVPPMSEFAPLPEVPPMPDPPPSAPMQNLPPPSPCENVVTITGNVPLAGTTHSTAPKQKPAIIHEGKVITGDVLLGKKITGEPTKMENLTSPGEVTVCGKVFAKDSRVIKGGRTVTVISFTDKTSSATLKFFTSSKQKADAEVTIQKGMTLLVHGKYSRDEFEKEFIIEPISIMKVELPEKIDDYDGEQKRVELHLHTKMSDMDATNSPSEYVNLAYKWGHRAIAITDHGNVQAYPEAMNTYEKIKKSDPEADFKVIYGMEAYFVNDGKPIVAEGGRFSLYGETAEFVVFDLETTGLTPANCKITEIGAVKLRNMEIVEEFSTFVNPGEPIPDTTIKLNGITDDMVRDAPYEKEAFEKFLGFCGSCKCLVAHNADFDMSFLRSGFTRCNISCDFASIDTVALSRAAVPERKSHKLNLMAEYFKLPAFEHHRALDDARTTALLFARIVGDAKKSRASTGNFRVSDLNTILGGVDIKKEKYKHLTILVRSKKGLKNLYKLISYSNLHYYHSKPRIPLSELVKHREGLLLGTACEAGELFQAILEERPAQTLEEIAGFYDFLEIMPSGVNEFLIRKGEVANTFKLELYNKKIYDLGKKLGKLVVATGDVHFMTSDDSIFREILQTGQGYKDADNQAPLYFRTTAEMLAEFTYLAKGEEESKAAAYEVVVTNPNKIADMIGGDDEEIRPIPRGEYRPYIEGAEEELTTLCRNRAKELYGEPLHEIIQKSIDKELNSIIKHGFSVLYLIAQKLVKRSEDDGYLVGSRGSVGSSLAAHLSGISEVNPLPPHYRCPKCKSTEFTNDPNIGSGFDLPPKQCPECSADMVRDGHDIPFETFLGFDGDKAPDIDLNFSGEYQSQAHRYTEELFGKDYVFKAGTISAIQEKTAFGFVKKYMEGKGFSPSKAEINRLVTGCVGVKRTTSQHPGGMLVVPTGYEVYDFTPIQHPAEKSEGDTITTHFDYRALHDTITKLDELGHDVPTLYKHLGDTTGIKITDVPNSDERVMKLFTSAEPLNLSEPNQFFDIGTYGLPEMGTPFVVQMLKEAQPKTFSDLLQISGLSHGTDVWLGNARDLISSGQCTISEVIGTRDNIMVYLMQRGMKPSLAFKITEITRKGGATKFFDDEIYEAFKTHEIPDWYVDSCKKIKYMFPKAHAAAYVMGAVKLGWFKVEHPTAFYSAALMRHTENIDVNTAIKGKDAVRKKLEALAAMPEKGEGAKTPKDRGAYDALLMVYEMQLRGIELKAPHYKKSHPTRYMISDNSLILPYSAIEGCGENAARRIYEVIEGGEYLCIDDIRTKSALNKTVLEKLSDTGFFGDLPETAQMSLFDM
ncbi:MAG: PolC-type DNA polymerase III [Oscillospiraceae bacterium]|nr:PolC-type DNA polymerase III [Oscillospiraceae bacterium]